MHREREKADVGAPHPGCWMVAPLWPQRVHRARCLTVVLIFAVIFVLIVLLWPLGRSPWP